jgi:hypothetical protein
MGSSVFGVCMLQVANGSIEVLIADEYENLRYQEMAEKVMDIIRGLNRTQVDQSYLYSVKIYVDAANPEFITTLKELVGETTRWEYIQDKMPDALGKLSKEDTSYDNVLDAFRLALKGIKVVKKEREIE